MRSSALAHVRLPAKTRMTALAHASRRAPTWAPLRWLPVASWMLLITYWSSQSDLPIDHPRIARLLHGEQHELAHTAAFAILAVLVRWALGDTPRAIGTSWLVATLFGLMDEIHQAFTPRRTPDPADLLVDSLAALAAAVAADAFVAGKAGRWAPSRFVAPLAVAGVAAWCFLLLLPLPSASTVRTGRQAVMTLERRLPDPVGHLAGSAVRHSVAMAVALRSELRERL